MPGFGSSEFPDTPGYDSRWEDVPETEVVFVSEEDDRIDQLNAFIDRITENPGFRSVVRTHLDALSRSPGSLDYGDPLARQLVRDVVAYALTYAETARSETPPQAPNDARHNLEAARSAFQQISDDARDAVDDLNAILGD
jgi:hypothetical protein